MKLDKFRKDRAIPKLGRVTSENREVATLEALSGLAKKRIQKNVTPVDIVTSTKNTRVAFIMLPEWNPSFPPFNLARLSAVSQKAGYTTKLFDLNIEIFKDRNWEAEIGYDPWNGARDWHWTPENYEKDLHPHLKPVIDKQLQKVLDFKPDVVCFTLYYCNGLPSFYFAEQLKDLLPNLVIAGGGPWMQTDFYQVKNRMYKGKNLFNYGCIGEGEIIILKILSEVETGYYKSLKEIQIYTQPEEQRIDLNQLPLPDYKDVDVNKYLFPNGALSELSRGCVAKCTFCEETHFWKYRQRLANDAISEIEHLYYSKGTDVFWFLDSLVNGNLKELKEFCEQVVERKLDIHWTGYSRCNGKMDLEYYKILAAGGCTFLNYGCESGSNKVLRDIDKRVTKEEMEQNFIDSKKVGIGAMTNWIVGFPTEDFKDFADTLTFLWRNRNNAITVIATASGFGLGDRTIVGQNPAKFNVANYKYCGNWITKDHSKGKPHTLSRVKEFVIFLQHIPFEDIYVSIPLRPNLPLKHYTLVWNNPETINEIEYEEFDYNIIETGINKWADNLVNEMFVLFRMFWRTRGGFTMELKYGIDLDMAEFGGQVAGEYIATQTFAISDDGNWYATIDCEFIQPPMPEEHKNLEVPYFPFAYFDNTRHNEAAAKRARKLSKPEHGTGNLPKEQIDEGLALTKHLNYNMDLSFKYKGKKTGKW
jgi:anaerobic magnesium-protoporphyrin IX monomethyl ester cyclase